MESFTRGWSFLTQAWKMAMADKDLIKPSIYALIGGFIVGLIGIIPLGLAFLIFDRAGDFGQIIIALVGAVIVFMQYAVTYIFSAMTIYLIYGYISEGDGKMEKAWAIVQRDWLDILSLAAASTLVNIIKNMVRGNRRQRNPIREGIANLINSLWTEATFLVLPIMVIEDLNLKDGLKRATYIVRNNLLMVGVSMVGVNMITGLIGFIFTLVGIGLGFAIAYPVIALAGNSIILVILAIGMGVLVASAFIMTASVINAYTSTAYHTCLYLWARDVERAGQGIPVAAPAPLAAVLGNNYATH